MPFSFKEVQGLVRNVQDPEFIKSFDGIHLAYYSFVPKNPKAIVIFYHGSGLYINNMYQWVGRELKEKCNIGCYMVDIRGHGHSEGDRGDAPNPESVYKDVALVVDLVKSKFGDKPVFLCGHSSGAGLIINYAAQDLQKREKGYMFLAPYLGPQSGTAIEHKNIDESFIKSMRVWVYILGSIFPNSFVTHFKALFFNYPESFLKDDPLILQWYTYAMSSATTPYEIDSLLRKIDKPVGIYIGDKDEQFMPKKVLACAELINSEVDARIIHNAGHLSILLQAPSLISNFIDKVNMH